MTSLNLRYGQKKRVNGGSLSTHIMESVGHQGQRAGTESDYICSVN